MSDIALRRRNSILLFRGMILVAIGLPLWWVRACLQVGILLYWNILRR